MSCRILGLHPDIGNLRNLINSNWTVWDEPLEICAAPFETELPLADRDHEFAGFTYQIYRKWDATSDDVPSMAGFIERQSEKYNARPGRPRS